MYFVYILVCLATKRSYVGQTDHLIRRYWMHCEGSTRTTRDRLERPFLVHWETFWRSRVQIPLVAPI
jgi:predicted GIY-YIG superfamily endonuclease